MASGSSSVAKTRAAITRRLREPLHQRAKGVLLIGAEPPYAYAAAPIIRKALAGAVPLIDCGTLEGAVSLCSRPRRARRYRPAFSRLRQLRPVQ